MVFKCMFYSIDLRRDVVSERWSLKAVDCLVQVVSNTGLTVLEIPKGIEKKKPARSSVSGFQFTLVPELSHL